MSARFGEAPRFRSPGFRCPNCGCMAGQLWRVLVPEDEIDRAYGNPLGRHVVWHQAVCQACGEASVWEELVERYPDEEDPLVSVTSQAGVRMVHPSTLVGPPPDAAMPEDTREVYEEARAVAAASPRAGAALLRLGLERLLRDVLQKPRIGLNDAIGVLSREGRVDKLGQQTMDLLRLHANDAVHPAGEIRSEEPLDPSILFRLLNVVVTQLIALPAETQALYEQLPEGKRAEIERRDRREGSV